MKFTDGLFKFPVKVYDTFSIIKNIKEEQEKFDELERPLMDDWVRGYIAIPINDIKGYGDAFSPEFKTGEVAEKGFDLTLVYTDRFGQLECTWKMAKFEEELNAFAAKYERGITDMVEDVFKEKELEINRKQAEKRKRRWFKW